MGQKQLQRWHGGNLLEAGKISLKEGTAKIGVSYRQAKGIRRAIQDKGMEGLIHGHVGRSSPRRITILVIL